MAPVRPKITPTARPKRKVVAKRPKKPKSPTIAKLKVELEALQKQLVIQRYGRDCYTCSAQDLQGSNCHLGHVPWPRTDLSIECKFSPEFTRIQCMVCNVHKGGRGADALQRMLDEGIDVVSLRKWNNETKLQHPNRGWYLAQINIYKGVLENSHNITST